MNPRAAFDGILRENGIGRTLILASTFRSGSTILGRLLRLQTNLAFDLEKFNAVSTWYKMSEARLEAALREALSPVRDGAYATKLMWPHRNNLARFLGLNGEAAGEFATLFPNTKFVQLVRRDKIAQAVSFFMAKSTGIWQVDAGEAQEAGPIDYSFHDINTYYQHFISHDYLWKLFFEKSGMTVPAYVYEDVQRDFKHAARAIMDFLSLEFHEEKWPDTLPIRQQEDERARALQVRFRDDLFAWSPHELLPTKLVGPATPR
ncbi:MAG: Stf0 family sulfotransferase [Hyphomicrobiales bacterium]|nr:Stf0 family sulfotransferase [Hyphomicrobiales bacterium]